MSFRVPAFVARHRHKLIKHAIDRARLIYDNRDRLKEPVRDVNGRELLPALPFLLQGLDEEEDGDPRILSRRRADFLQGFMSAWLVMLASASHRSKAVLSRQHAQRGRDPFMSLREWEHLADLLPRDNSGQLVGYTKSKRLRTQADGSIVQVEVEEAGDRIERYTRLMRDLGMLHETKQNRERLDDGRHRASGAAIRRVVWKKLYAFGGPFAKVARRLQRWVKQQIEKDREHQAAADDRFREQFEEQAGRRALYDEGDEGAELEVPDAPAPRAPGAPDPTIMDDVHEAHPTWTAPQVIAEARRIEAQLDAGDADTS